MAEKTYTYSEAAFPGGLLNPGRLKDEIQASPIVTALERIDTAGGSVSQGVLSGSYSVDIVFKAEPSQADKTALDGGGTQVEESPPLAGSLLVDHDNSPNPATPKVVELDASKKHVVEIQEVSPGPLLYRASPSPAAIDINAPDTEGFVEMTWPFDYWLLSVEYWAGSLSGAVIGDKISAELDRERDLTTLLGAAGELQSAEAASDDEVEVHPASIAAGLIQPGYFVRFAGVANPEYQIISINRTTNLAKLDRNLEAARQAGDPIFRTIAMGRGVWVLPSSVPEVFGATKIGGARIPAGWKLRVSYEATDGGGRDIYINAEGGIHEA